MEVTDETVTTAIIKDPAAVNAMLLDTPARRAFRTLSQIVLVAVILLIAAEVFPGTMDDISDHLPSYWQYAAAAALLYGITLGLNWIEQRGAIHPLFGTKASTKVK